MGAPRPSWRNVSGAWLGRPGATDVDGVVAAARREEPTYDHIGSTLGAHPGRPLQAFHRHLGRGDDVFAAAVDALRTWRPQRGIGAQVHPPDAAIEVGATVVVVLPVGPVALVAPNRVVAVLDEPDRFGYAYGSLPGHPERGEEGFVVERAADGSVRASITLDAAAGSLLARLGGPVTPLLQRRAVTAYLAALEEAARTR